MAGEIEQGKRTFIEHDGRVFELPSMHTATLYLQADGVMVVALRTAQAGSTFELRELERREDRLVVHLGALIACHQPPRKNEAHEVSGYPLPATRSGMPDE